MASCLERVANIFQISSLDLVSCMDYYVYIILTDLSVLRLATEPTTSQSSNNSILDNNTQNHQTPPITPKKDYNTIESSITSPSGLIEPDIPLSWQDLVYLLEYIHDWDYRPTYAKNNSSLLQIFLTYPGIELQYTVLSSILDIHGYDNTYGILYIPPLYTHTIQHIQHKIHHAYYDNNNNNNNNHSTISATTSQQIINNKQYEQCKQLHVPSAKTFIQVLSYYGNPQAVEYHYITRLYPYYHNGYIILHLLLNIINICISSNIIYIAFPDTSLIYHLVYYITKRGCCLTPYPFITEYFIYTINQLCQLGYSTQYISEHHQYNIYDVLHSTGIDCLPSDNRSLPGVLTSSSSSIPYLSSSRDQLDQRCDNNQTQTNNNPNLEKDTAENKENNNDSCDSVLYEILCNSIDIHTYAPRYTIRRNKQSENSHVDKSDESYNQDNTNIRSDSSDYEDNLIQWDNNISSLPTSSLNDTNRSQDTPLSSPIYSAQDNADGEIDDLSANPSRKSKFKTSQSTSYDQSIPLSLSATPSHPQGAYPFGLSDTRGNMRSKMTYVTPYHDALFRCLITNGMQILPADRCYYTSPMLLDYLMIPSSGLVSFYQWLYTYHYDRLYNAMHYRYNKHRVLCENNPDKTSYNTTYANPGQSPLLTPPDIPHYVPVQANSHRLYINTHDTISPSSYSEDYRYLRRDFYDYCHEQYNGALYTPPIAPAGGRYTGIFNQTNSTPSSRDDLTQIDNLALTKPIEYHIIPSSDSPRHFPCDPPFIFHWLQYSHLSYIYGPPITNIILKSTHTSILFDTNRHGMDILYILSQRPDLLTCEVIETLYTIHGIDPSIWIIPNSVYNASSGGLINQSHMSTLDYTTENDSTHPLVNNNTEKAQHDNCSEPKNDSYIINKSDTSNNIKMSPIPEHNHVFNYSNYDISSCSSYHINHCPDYHYHQHKSYNTSINSSFISQLWQQCQGTTINDNIALLTISPSFFMTRNLSNTNTLLQTPIDEHTIISLPHSSSDITTMAPIMLSPSVLASPGSDNIGPRSLSNSCCSCLSSSSKLSRKSNKRQYNSKQSSQYSQHKQHCNPLLYGHGITYRCINGLSINSHPSSPSFTPYIVPIPSQNTRFTLQDWKEADGYYFRNISDFKTYLRSQCIRILDFIEQTCRTTAQNRSQENIPEIMNIIKYMKDYISIVSLDS